MKPSRLDSGTSCKDIGLGKLPGATRWATILRVKGFRFYFFSREERRGHVHVQHADGEAKFWIDPNVELVANFSLKPKQIAEAQKLIEEHLNEIRSAWARHFPSGSH